MIDKKCKERFDMYDSGKQSATRIYPEFDGSNESWFAAGWNSKGSSLTGTRMRLRDVYNHLPKDGSIPFAVFTGLSNSIVALGGDPIDLSEVSKVYLERYKPIRIVMREDKERKLKGLVEHSFSMDFDEKLACIFWSGKAFSILGEHELDGEKWAKGNAKPGDFIFDPLDPFTCPVDIDWAAWLSATDKFGKRNAPFSVRQIEIEEEDAVLK